MLIRPGGIGSFRTQALRFIISVFGAGAWNDAAVWNDADTWKDA